MVERERALQGHRCEWASSSARQRLPSASTACLSFIALRQDVEWSRYNHLIIELLLLLLLLLQSREGWPPTREMKQWWFTDYPE